jgi:glutamate racemase
MAAENSVYPAAMNLLVFDSGIGGLGVVREIRLLQPAAGIIYLADNAGFPYGEKPDSVLLPRIVGLIGRAIEIFRPDAVVIACNTASTIALAALRAAYNVPFIGCVPPVKPAAAASLSRHIGLLATPATIRRPYLQNLIDTYAAGCTVHSLGTPVLADLAEAKLFGHEVARTSLTAAIAPLFAQDGAKNIDAIALGCTHYTFLLPELRVLHPDIAFFDPALPVARQCFAVTQHFNGAPPANRIFYTAALPDAEFFAANLPDFGFYEVEILSGLS